MLVEELLSKLSISYEKIIFVSFSEKQERLLDAQLSLSPKVSEQCWNNGPREQEENAVYIFSIPTDGWPDFLDLYAFTATGPRRVYVLLSKESTNRIGQILLESVASGRFLKNLTPFTSLGKDYCLEIAGVDTVGNGYLERAASESVIERLERKRLRSELLSVKLILEKERKKYSGEIKALEDKIQQYENEIEKLAALKQQNRSLQSSLSNIKAELGYHRDRSKLLKSSFSYRFGNLFAEAGRSPRNVIILPYTVMMFLVLGFIRKASARLRKKNQISNGDEKCGVKGAKKDDPSDGNGALGTSLKRISDENLDKLATYLIDIEPQGDWVALIGRHRLPEHLKADSNVHQLHPNTWHSLFKKRLPRRVVINSDDITKGGAWSSCLEGGAYGYPTHLVQLLSFCSMHSIETVLWDTAELGEGRASSEFSHFFSKIYVADKPGKEPTREGSDHEPQNA